MLHVYNSKCIQIPAYLSVKSREWFRCTVCRPRILNWLPSYNSLLTFIWWMKNVWFLNPLCCFVGKFMVIYLCEYFNVIYYKLVLIHKDRNLSLRVVLADLPKALVSVFNKTFFFSLRRRMNGCFVKGYPCRLG